MVQTRPQQQVVKMDELNRALRQTAADRHLSSGERQALRETI